MTNRNFYQIHAKGVEELEQAIAAELEVDDPDEEKAKAILEQADESNPPAN